MSDQIDRLLAETQSTDDPELRGLLTELHRAATSVHPMPSAEISALMRPRRRRSVSRRGVVTALVVVGMVGAGVTAAAASPDVQSAARQVYQAVTGAIVAGTAGFAPHDDHASPVPSVTPFRGASSPHPDATDHPGPSDHPGNGATKAATPHPGAPRDGSSGHPTSPPNGNPGKGNKP